MRDCRDFKITGASRWIERTLCIGIGYRLTMRLGRMLIAATVGAALLSGMPAASSARADEYYNQAAQRLSQLRRANRRDDIDRLLSQMLAHTQQTNQSMLTACTYSEMASTYTDWGRYGDAERCAREALALVDRIDANEAVKGAICSDCSKFYFAQSRYGDAAKLLRRASSHLGNHFGTRSDEYSQAIEDLASVLDQAGNHTEAERLYKQCFEIRYRNHGLESALIAQTLYNLADSYAIQHRLSEAESLLIDAGTICSRVNDAPLSLVARVTSRLGQVYRMTKRYAEAEPQLKKAHALFLQAAGPRNPLSQNTELARLYFAMGRYDEAEQLLRQDLANGESYFGANHADNSLTLLTLMRIAIKRKQYDDADAFAGRLRNILDSAEAARDQWISLTGLEAEVAWGKGDRQHGIELATKAVDLAEEERGYFTGGEQQVAESFSSDRYHYLRAANYLRQAGRLDDAFQMAERGRARGLADQMALAQVDLLAGLPPRQARQLREAQDRARDQLRIVEGQLAELDTRREVPREKKLRQREALIEQLQLARAQCLAAYADIRSASPAFRRTIGERFAGVPLAELRSWLAKEQALLLEYTIGEDGSEVYAIDGESGASRVHYPELSAEQAQVLECAAGPVTTESLESILMNEAKTGVLQLISNAKSGETPNEKLHALWEVLLSQSDRAAIAAGKYKQVIVIPDGVLALLPFEALIVDAGATPKYLLDLEANVVYSPAATILYNLSQRPAAAIPEGREAVLAVGDPAYGKRAAEQEVARGEVLARYGGMGGQLNRLPYSGLEAKWVAQSFSRNGIKAGVLEDASATEAAVRAHSTNRRIVHLACHGLTDQNSGNFFGALALAPGRDPANSADDGFLEMNEIYGLDLRACEMAILSACQTNYGPKQEGEGVWALTRGFLVAGSRRVVASNWLVDDEAAASLISYCCGIVAKQQKEKSAVQYSAALTEAKRWVRQQAKWQHPYYWATFVLIGPN